MHLQYMEIPRLGVKWEIQQPAYTSAPAMWDPSQILNLQRSSWQGWILNPLGTARNQAAFPWILVGFLIC